MGSEALQAIHHDLRQQTENPLMEEASFEAHIYKSHDVKCLHLLERIQVFHHRISCSLQQLLVRLYSCPLK